MPETSPEATTQPETTDSNQETTTQPNETTEGNREETTTQPGQETTTVSNVEETTNIENTSTKRPSNGNSSCPPLTEEGQAHYVCPTGFRRHPQDCGMFYQCTQSPETSHLSIVSFNCPNGTVYDEEAIQCRDRTDNDNCPSKSLDPSLLRGTIFDTDHEESPTVRYLKPFIGTKVTFISF